MIENTTTETLVEPAALAAATTESAAEPQTGEGRKYRERAQAAEAERDEMRQQLAELAEQLAALRTAEVDRIAVPHGMKAAAILAAGHELDDLLDDNGTVDAEKVASAARLTKETLGIVSTAAAAPADGQGKTGRIGDGDTDDWEGAFKPRV